MTYTEPVNQTGLASIFNYADSVSGGLYGVGIVMSLFFIVLLYMKARGTETSDSFVVAGFTASIVGILLFFLEIFSGGYLAIIISITAISAFWSLYSREG